MKKYGKVFLAIAISMIVVLAACMPTAPQQQAVTACDVTGTVNELNRFNGTDCNGINKYGSELVYASGAKFTYIDNIVYLCSEGSARWTCSPMIGYEIADGNLIPIPEQPISAEIPTATQQVQFEDPLPILPTAQQLEQYSLIPSATPVFSEGKLQPDYLKQSIPTIGTLQTPPSDNSPYCFCGREGKDLIYGEISGGKKIEIKYIGVFEEITPVLTGSYKPIYTGYDEINLQNKEQLVASIAPNNTIELTDGSTTNWQVIAVYCMPTDRTPYQTQALEYVQGGVYRVKANNVYAYYQTLGYEVSYIDNETGRSLDPNAPPANEMVQWPIPNITIVP